jgi:hypothetical protein
MAILEISSARQENQTYDEAVHLAAGYSYLKTGDYRMSQDHPPLAKYLVAFPLLFLHLDLPLDDPSWKRGDAFAFGERFLYHNRLPADTILFLSRLPTMLVSLCLGLAIALWTRKEFGAPAALLALLLYAFDPTILAHSRYTTNDVAVTLFVLLACLAWGSFLRSRKTTSLIAASILLALAMVTKFSAVFLLPTFAILYVILGRKDRALFTERLVLRSVGSLLAAIVLIVALAYAPQAKKLLPVTADQKAADPSLEMLADIQASSGIGRALIWLGGALGLQQHPFLLGINEQATHNAQGHQSYLLGQTSQFGRWYYFPVAFAVKTPAATLAALLLAAVLAFRFRRQLDVRCFLLAVPVAVYLAFSSWSSVNIGIRHLLPIYPFLFIFTGAMLAGFDWRRKQIVISMIAIALVAESLSVYPHPLAFFNVLAGGPGNGTRYLSDSNLDWGQDLENLNSYMEARHIPRVCLSYFGSADPDYYGIAHDYLPVSSETGQRADLNCVAAVSATLLYGAYVPADDYAWLRERTPVAKVGYSIYVYDLRH